MLRSPFLGWCICTPNLDLFSASTCCLFLGELLSADGSHPTQGTARPSLGQPAVIQWLKQRTKGCPLVRQLCGTADAPESSVGEAKARLYLGPHPCLTLSHFPVVLRLSVCIRIALEIGYTTDYR